MSDMQKFESRITNSTRNTFFATITFLIKILLQFVVRAIFIRFLAVEYLGLNGLFTNVLNVLSLAELGLGNAIVYSMYKPISDNDIEKIKSLTRLYRNFYFVIGLTITVIGLAVIPLLPFLIKDAPSISIDLNLVYVLFLAQTVIGYFFAYRRALVFANQRNDVESKITSITQILLAIAQVLVLVFTKNYYLYVLTILLSILFDSLLVFYFSYKLFPQIKGKAAKLNKQDVKIIAKNSGAMVFHKIGSAAVFSTDSIIISAFIGVGILGIYSNYSLVTMALASIINLMCTAIRGSIGNLIATSTIEKTYKIFRNLTMILFWGVGFFFIGILCCFQDFIVLFAGNDAYLLSFPNVLLICISFYLTYTKGIVGAFKECSGLFWNDRFKPLAEAGLNLLLDIILVIYMGLPGVFLATIISTIAAPLWIEPYVLYKNYFKISATKYLVIYLKYTLITAISAVITYFLCSLVQTQILFLNLLIKIAICCTLPNILYFIVLYKTEEFKHLRSILKSMLKKEKSNTIKVVGVVLSGGTGERFQSSIPKQYLNLCDEQVISYPINALKNSSVTNVLIACDESFSKDIIDKYHVSTCPSGKNRNETIYNALQYIHNTFSFAEAVIFLDAARPLVTSKNIDEIIHLLNSHDGVITCASITDSLGNVENTFINREDFYLIQTPEAFKLPLLANFDATGSATAIVQQIESANIKKYFGMLTNTKITYPADLKIAEVLMNLNKEDF